MNLTLDFILCILFGYLGIHKFYERKIKIGLVYLFTFGLFGVGWIIDIVILFLKLLNSLLSNYNNADNNKRIVVDNVSSSTQNNISENATVFTDTSSMFNKEVAVIDECNNKKMIKQFCKRIDNEDLALLSGTSYDNDNKIYHKYLDCYEDWSTSLKLSFNGWQIKKIRDLQNYSECKRCYEREYRKRHPNAKITGYDFNYYYEDLQSSQNNF